MEGFQIKTLLPFCPIRLLRYFFVNKNCLKIEKGKKIKIQKDFKVSLSGDILSFYLKNKDIEFRFLGNNTCTI